MFTLDPITLLYWLGSGLIGGIVIHLLLPGEVKGGLTSTVVLSAIAGILGGFFGTRYQELQSGTIFLSPLLFAALGGIIAALLLKLVLRDRRHFRAGNV